MTTLISTNKTDTVWNQRATSLFFMPVKCVALSSNNNLLGVPPLASSRAEERLSRNKLLYIGSKNMFWGENGAAWTTETPRYENCKWFKSRKSRQKQCMKLAWLTESFIDDPCIRTQQDKKNYLIPGINNKLVERLQTLACALQI